MTVREYPVLRAIEAAHYLLYLRSEDFFAPEPMTNLKLQKLLYYAQGFSLALDDHPLFAEAIVAWKHGPVVASVDVAYRQ